MYPDYGTPGHPNLDPYYVSPADEAKAIAERDEQRENLRDALIATISDERGDLWRSEIVQIVAEVLATVKAAPDERE